MPRITKHASTTRALLIMLRDQGKTVEQCADRRIMNRSVDTLKRWCRRFNIEFPDYKPRPKKEPPQMPTLKDLAAIALKQMEEAYFPWFAAGVVTVVTFLACLQAGL